MPAADISLTKALKAVRKKKIWAKGQKFIKQISGEAASEKKVFLAGRPNLNYGFRLKQPTNKHRKRLSQKKKRISASFNAPRRESGREGRGECGHVPLNFASGCHLNRQDKNFCCLRQYCHNYNKQKHKFRITRNNKNKYITSLKEG